jgi:hypothetical protein
MDARQTKARELADRGRVVQQKDGSWVVFSLTSTGKYRVTLDPVSCDCPDFELRQEPCKHVLAVRQAEAQGRADKTPGKTRAPENAPLQHPKKTYPQNCPAYDAAQQNEKAEFITLLADRCRNIEAPARKPGKGRPPAPLAAQAFAACYKVFSGFSGRRFATDLNDAETKGHVSEAVSHSSIARFFAAEENFDLLRNLVTWSSLPLAALESTFAPDSRGFYASKFYK